MGLYYIFVYLFVYGVKFFRLKNQEEKDKRKYFHVSLEIVYASMGVVASIIATYKDQDLISSIAIAIVLLTIFSTTLDFIDDKKFGLTTKTIAHIFLSVSVMGSVFMYANLTHRFWPKIFSSEDKKDDITKSYSVYITFNDISDKVALSKDIRFIKKYDVNGTNLSEEDAISQAKKLFEKDASIRPSASRNPKLYKNVTREEAIQVVPELTIAKEIIKKN